MSFIRRMDHFTVLTDRLALTCAFYERLGLRPGPRPDFPVPGVWLYAGEEAVLHLLEVEALPAGRAGVLDHMAFRGEDPVALLEMLRAQGIAYRLIRAPRPFSQWQVFFEDPNGAQVEIDFDGGARLPPHLKEGGTPAL